MVSWGSLPLPSLPPSPHDEPPKLWAVPGKFPAFMESSMRWEFKRSVRFARPPPSWRTPPFSRFRLRSSGPHGSGTNTLPKIGCDLPSYRHKLGRVSSRVPVGTMHVGLRHSNRVQCRPQLKSFFAKKRPAGRDCLGPHGNRNRGQTMMHTVIH